jgi:surfactin synthase thioesterase subunit
MGIARFSVAADSDGAWRAIEAAPHNTRDPTNAIKLWRLWSEQVEGEMLPGGHFIPEEQPQAVVSHFRRFFAS